MMSLNTSDFGIELKKLGYDFFSGVPCSFLDSLFNYAISEATFVMSTNEGDAVAVCAGAYLAGKKTVVMMQNSGLANAISPITSLNYCFRLPVLGFVSLRGEKGIKDEPQHELMGVITEKLLDIMQVKWGYLSNDMDEAKRQLAYADGLIADNVPFFFIVKKGVFSKVALNEHKSVSKGNNAMRAKYSKDELPTRSEALRIILSNKYSEDVLIATTGKTGRELFEMEDASSNFYMVGSMGCASSIGLGFALNNNDRKVIVIDGDGALLMRMGSMATNAHYSPDNMLHILLDNNAHDSTGGQFTVSNNIDFVQIAASIGYENSLYVHSLAELDKEIIVWNDRPRLTFIHLKIKKGSRENLGRPLIKPFEVKERFMRFVSEKI